MRTRIGFLAFVAISLWWQAAAAAPSVDFPTEVKKSPQSAEIERTVVAHFQQQADFRATDLITRDEAAPLLAKLKRAGLLRTDAGKILERLPVKGEFLVEQLRSDTGRNFMRQISALPNGYDRVDRLSRMPHGEQTVRDLIRGPGGTKLIEYMTTTQGGKALGKQLDQAPDGARFNAPTGRIYTAAMLLAVLQQDYPDAKTAAAPKQH